MQKRYPDAKKAKKFFQDKLSFTTGPVELNRWINERQDLVVVDVRAPEHYNEGHIPGAINIPKDRWTQPSGLQKKKLNVVYCYTQTCHLAAGAAVEFAGKGFPVMELEGGFETWQAKQLPIETSQQRSHARTPALAGTGV